MSHKRKTGIPMYDEKFKYLNRHQTKHWLIKNIIKSSGRLYEKNTSILDNFWICPITWEILRTVRRPTTLHHAKVHNMVINQKRFPLLYNSLLNLMATTEIQNDWSSFGKISEYQADKIESFLKRHPKAEAFVNRLEDINYFKER